MHVINKNATKLLNLRYGINKIFYSNLFLFFSFSPVLLLLALFSLPGMSLIQTYLAITWFVLFLYFKCENFVNAYSKEKNKTRTNKQANKQKTKNYVNRCSYKIRLWFFLILKLRRIAVECSALFKFSSARQIGLGNAAGNGKWDAGN